VRLPNGVFMGMMQISQSTFQNTNSQKSRFNLMNVPNAGQVKLCVLKTVLFCQIPIPPFPLKVVLIAFSVRIFVRERLFLSSSKFSQLKKSNTPFILKNAQSVKKATKPLPFMKINV